jgi:hypothetical protein
MYGVEKITLTRPEYNLMQRRLAKLAALESRGVNYWEFHDEALIEWKREEALSDLLSAIIDEINDFLTEAEIDQPAGYGCGYSITFDEGQMENILKGFADKYVRIKTDDR